MGNSKLREISSKIISYKVASKDVSEMGIEDVKQDNQVIVTDVKLPADSPARMKVLRAEGKKWYMTVVYHQDTERPFALFCTTNHREKSIPVSDAVERLISLAMDKGILQEHVDKLKEKIETDNNVNKLTRVISLLLRHNVSLVDIVATLDLVEDMFVGTFLFQVKKFLSAYIKDGEKVDGGKCDECGSNNVVYMEGCFQCVDCGSGHCG